MYMPEKIPRKSNMTYYGGMCSLTYLELYEVMNLNSSITNRSRPNFISVLSCNMVIHKFLIF